MAIDTLDRTTQWPTWAETTVPSSVPQPQHQAHTALEDRLPEDLAAVRAEDASARLSMHDILTAWRVADRALAELAEGTPEWAAVNATIISLRASYRARFDDYITGVSR
jgi:hypothetical protein